MNLREQVHGMVDRMREQDLERAMEFLNHVEEAWLNDALSRAGIGLPEISANLIVSPLTGPGKTASEQLIEDRK